MPFLAQYSRRVIPLFANPSTILRISSLLRIPPLSTEFSHANKMGSSDAYVRPVIAEGPASTMHCAFLPLVQTLAELRRVQGTGVVSGFTAINRGEGVTFVVESLAWELAKYTGEQVLLTTPAGLRSISTAHFRDEVWHGFQPVRRLTRLGGDLPGGLRWKDLHNLRQRFGFVLVDCPALRESDAFLTVSRLCDGIGLVVGAGQVHRNELAYAQNVLRTLSVNILGLVLNNQKDALPELISRFL